MNTKPTKYSKHKLKQKRRTDKYKRRNKQNKKNGEVCE